MAPEVEVAQRLQGDGVNRQLFELIWKKDLLSQQSITLRIPDTIVFKYNCPSVWYFTSVDGTIKRKHKAKLDAECILREFLKRPLACGIVAYYVQTAVDVEDAPRGLTESGLAPTTIEYLNEEQLRELLLNRQMNRGDGLLQKFLEPPDGRNNMIRAQWSPKVCLIERRINRLNLNDTHYDMYERAVTFEGPDFHSEVTPVRGATLANKVDHIADAIIQHVAGVTNDRVKITRLALNFKVDHKDRLHFLFASSVRLLGCSQPLEVNTMLQVPEYIHRAQSVSRTAPAVLLRSLVCPTCQQKVHPEMLFEVAYRVIIEYEEQRCNAERRVRPEPPLNVPVWHEMTEAASEQARPAEDLFVDPEFPATNESIGGVKGDAANENVRYYLREVMSHIVPGWVRPCEMIGKDAGQYKLHGIEGEPCLFKHVSPRDIKQGYLGDCWLVSSFSTLAEYPDRVRSLFKQQKLSEDGRYDIRLYCPLEEEWKVVTIDDRLPYWKKTFSYGQVCFAQPSKENEFWPCLLEKAVAKLVQAYYRLDGGFEQIALEMLTGKPALCISLSLDASHTSYVLTSGLDETSAKHATVFQRVRSIDEKWDYWTKDAAAWCDNQSELSDLWVWDRMKSWDEEGYSIACGSRGDYKGIIAGHAYTILRLLDVTVTRGEKTERLQLLHVRNPHMKNEWTGKWHDSDSYTWNAYPEALDACKHKVGYNDNGVFWMDWEDFKQGFMEFTVNFDQQDKGRRYTDDSAEAQFEHKAVPEAFARLHPRLEPEEYVELRKELVFQQKFAGVCENCYLRFSTARLGAVQRLLAPELKKGSAAAEKQELGLLGTEDAESVELVGTGRRDPERLALRRKVTRQKILQRQGLVDSWWEAADTALPKRAASCPKLPSWGPNHSGAVLWAPAPVLAHRPRAPAAPVPRGAGHSSVEVLFPEYSSIIGKGTSQSSTDAVLVKCLARMLELRLRH
ncbi:Calpain-type cysteine protease DEK1 (Phytocalpain DEK1) (Protein DEFECTIVE KERNEL 1) (ZmDEK1) [Durusdinium trenchii]|uniref:Calpain-type cysteine protease DEK1 (Phytocalpain DEK1) (Protein DEFECTIVE KERNEL 1) (ZmDEK1) n=1 Tax=Durusdinium trenchii TaxID=1381693 RepID=A0ABP0M6E4_9DINO